MTPPENGNAQTPLRICCGPRCGAEAEHRAVYRAIEKAADARNIPVEPTLCRALCGAGVTVVAPDGEKHKLRAGDVPHFVLTAVGRGTFTK